MLKIGVILEILIVSQLVNKFKTSIGSECLLPRAQQPRTQHYNQATESHALFLENTLKCPGLSD